VQKSGQSAEEVLQVLSEQLEIKSLIWFLIFNLICWLRPTLSAAQLSDNYFLVIINLYFYIYSSVYFFQKLQCHQLKVKALNFTSYISSKKNEILVFTTFNDKKLFESFKSVQAHLDLGLRRRKEWLKREELAFDLRKDHQRLQCNRFCHCNWLHRVRNHCCKSCHCLRKLVWISAHNGRHRQTEVDLKTTGKKYMYLCNVDICFLIRDRLTTGWPHRAGGGPYDFSFTISTKSFLGQLWRSRAFQKAPLYRNTNVYIYFEKNRGQGAVPKSAKSILFANF
jgi:hypothetical protein